jgi:hypothetical protein
MPIESIIGRDPEDEESLTELGFYWREMGGVRVLVCRPLEDAGFVNGFSTRMGGVSPYPEGSLNLAGFDEDSADNIRENRRRFLSALGAKHELATGWQVHGRWTARLRATRKNATRSSANGRAFCLA